MFGFLKNIFKKMSIEELLALPIDEYSLKSTKLRYFEQYYDAGRDNLGDIQDKMIVSFEEAEKRLRNYIHLNPTSLIEGSTLVTIGFVATDEGIYIQFIKNEKEIDYLEIYSKELNVSFQNKNYSAEDFVKALKVFWSLKNVKEKSF